LEKLILSPISQFLKLKKLCFCGIFHCPPLYPSGKAGVMPRVLWKLDGF
jgi:hypothetical protein